MCSVAELRLFSITLLINTFIMNIDNENSKRVDTKMSYQRYKNLSYILKFQIKIRIIVFIFTYNGMDTKSSCHRHQNFVS